jgi:hypothetical protein
MSEYKTCYHCGQQFKFSENINVTTGRPFKLNENGLEHDCTANIEANKNKKNKYANTIRVEDEDGNQFNAMLCKFNCKERVYRNESLSQEPKLIEVKTGFHHDYQRCYNVHKDKGLGFEDLTEENRKMFEHKTYLLTWDELVSGLTEQEINIIKMGMPPDSKMRKGFDPEKKDPLVGNLMLHYLGVTQEMYDEMFMNPDELEKKKKQIVKAEEEEDKDQVKLL